MRIFDIRFFSIVLAAISGVMVFTLTVTGQTVPPPTFIDTLNKGAEVYITDTDVAVPATNPMADTHQFLKTVVPASIQEPKPDAATAAAAAPSRYKIQVLAATVEAEVVKQKADLASKTDLSVIIIFEAPYYKLYIGDFQERSDAEHYLTRLKDLGYDGVWIVQKADSLR